MVTEGTQKRDAGLSEGEGVIDPLSKDTTHTKPLSDVAVPSCLLLQDSSSTVLQYALVLPPHARDVGDQRVQVMPKPEHT